MALNKQRKRLRSLLRINFEKILFAMTLWSKKWKRKEMFFSPFSECEQHIRHLYVLQGQLSNGQRFQKTYLTYIEVIKEYANQIQNRSCQLYITTIILKQVHADRSVIL